MLAFPWISISILPVRLLVPLVLVFLCIGCTSSTQDASVSPSGRRIDTLSRYNDGSPKIVAVSRGDSLLERRRYRSTGLLSKVVSGNSVQTYFDLHDPDSAAILQDYLQGRWRNLSADTTRKQSSAFYVFESDRLTFETPSHTPLESLNVEYKNNRMLTTEDGMTVTAQIVGFDTVRVTGYTLVRQPEADSTG